jgi:hypothetical protein
MHPAQQQVVAQYNQLLQQSGAQLNGLLQQAAAGCQQMIAQNPTDGMPLGNALGAIEQQVKGLRKQANDAFRPHFDHLCTIGPAEPGHNEMKRALRYWELWAEEAWMRFENHWRVEQYRAMWPAVQAGMAKPLPCSRCGGPLRRTTPHKTESITCPACHTVNQAMPEAVVAGYFGGMPHYFAEHALIGKKMEIAKFRAQWEDYREAENAAGRDWPDEPLEHLKQWEQLELAYWNAYAQERVKNEGGPQDDVRTLVESRMKPFYEQLNLNDVWRAAHGMQTISAKQAVPKHLENVDEWGPLNPRDPNFVENYWVHQLLLEWSEREPDKHAAILKQLGYKEELHWQLVERTFTRHYSEFMSTAEGQAILNKAGMHAMNENQKLAVVGAAAGGLLDPVEGVSIAVYGALQVKQPNLSPQEFQTLLAQHQMDQAKWERVAKGWLDRMTRDTTGAVATEYSKAFMSGQGGQFAAAGQASADVMAQGQMGLAGPAASAEPVSFEKYCEISGAMQAWTKQGKDISAMLDKAFKISAMDVSTISVYWSQKMMADLSMFDKQATLTARYEQQYLAMP